MTRFASVDYTIDNISFATWQGCSDCSGGPAPGARALLAYWLEQTPDEATSMGIYNCRPVRGATSLSIHACGRAVDMGVPVSVAGHRMMMQFLNKLGPHAEGLGIQLIIFSRLSGSARNPWPTQYNGVHPHFDHAHVELNERAARDLTLATLRDRVGDVFTDTRPEPEPEPQKTWTEELVENLPTRRRRTDFSREDRFDGRIQGLLAEAGVLDLDRNTVRVGRVRRFDRRFGPSTEQAVRAFQLRANIAADGIVGPITWTKLLGR